MFGNLSKEEIEAVLTNNVFGHIGCHDKGKTYVVPINYVYDGKQIIGHSVAGTKIHMMRSNPRVCFQVEEINDFSNWKSVIVWGEYHEITDSQERQHAMKFFTDHTLHIKISKPAGSTDVMKNEKHPHSFNDMKPVIYRIIITEKTGRYEKN